jgi:hypothetical protein
LTWVVSDFAPDAGVGEGVGAPCKVTPTKQIAPSRTRSIPRDEIIVSLFFMSILFRDCRSFRQVSVISYPRSTRNNAYKSRGQNGIVCAQLPFITCCDGYCCRLFVLGSWIVVWRWSQPLAALDQGWQTLITPCASASIVKPVYSLLQCSMITRPALVHP